MDNKIQLVTYVSFVSLTQEYSPVVTW
ncbi:hypothetical protein ACU5DF_20030 [Aliivibrio wodanis]